MVVVDPVVIAVVLAPDTNTACRSSPNRRRCKIAVKPGILGNIVRKYTFYSMETQVCELVCHYLA